MTISRELIRYESKMSKVQGGQYSGSGIEF